MKHILLFICLALCSLVTKAEERDGYAIQRVQVSGHNAYLLTPHASATQQSPAVLVLHDHGAWFSIGKEKMTTPLWNPALDSITNVRIADDSKRWISKCYSGIAVADSLAKAGFVVLVTDALYWGEQALVNRQITDLKSYNKSLKEYQPTFYEEHLKKTGEPWFETILREDREAVSYLLSLPNVDKGRVFCFGFSMGAYRSWQLAAADSRVAACAAAHWMTTGASQGGFLINASSYSMFRPSLYLPHTSLNGTIMPAREYAEIAADIFPRPLLLQYGERDHLFPEPGLGNAIQLLRDGYKQNPTALTTIGYDTDHLFTKDHLHDLLEWLKAL